MASSQCPGYCGAQDTFYVGTLKGVGRIYQQTFVDTYAKVGFTKLYDVKTAITAADLLNDRVIPFYEEHSIPLCRVLTDRGSEYCGNPERTDDLLVPRHRVVSSLRYSMSTLGDDTSPSHHVRFGLSEYR